MFTHIAVYIRSGGLQAPHAHGVVARAGEEAARRQPRPRPLPGHAPTHHIHAPDARRVV